jgi:hypothetical protein
MIDLAKVIEYDSESNVLDFKKEQYPLGKNVKRNEFLKDISAFANHYSEADKYIIIGVVEKNGRASAFENIENLVDESKYQQFLYENIEPKITFEYKSFVYKGFKLAYFRLYNNSDAPYLIKRDIKNPIDDNTDFHIGDGFIRIGTSIRRLNRKDFDSIYEAKYKALDRKSDIKITPYSKISKDELLSPYDLKYLDIEIENTSNKSIDLDIEMKVLLRKGYRLINESVLKRELRKKTQNTSPLTHSFDPIIEMPNLNVKFVESGDHILVASSLKIEQNSKIDDIFEGVVCVLQEKSNRILAEVCIRSDDFTKGALIVQLEFIT